MGSEGNPQLVLHVLRIVLENVLRVNYHDRSHYFYTFSLPLLLAPSALQMGPKH